MAATQRRRSAVTNGRARTELGLFDPEPASKAPRPRACDGPARRTSTATFPWPSSPTDAPTPKTRRISAPATESGDRASTIDERTRIPAAATRARRRRRPPELVFVRRGGRRPGAGRKRKTTQPLVHHRPRSEISGRAPLHVTLRVQEGRPSLRTHAVHAIVRSAIGASAVRPGFRIVHYAALANHVHLVCEASSTDALARHVKGLAVRLARRLNAHWKRRGRIFAGRFHARELRTPREVHHALRHVLGNAQHHGLVRLGELDPCSSAAAFVAADTTLETGLARPRTWLLRTGWRRHGPLVLTR